MAPYKNEKINDIEELDELEEKNSNEDLDILSQRYYKDNYEFDETDYDNDEYLAALE